MNQERRDFLKAMLIAPVAGLVPVTVAAAGLKPVVIALPKVEPQPSQYICYTVTVRQFELTFPDDVARRSMGAFLDLPGHTNSELYRGFEPGTLRVTNMQIYAKDENRDARVNFELWMHDEILTDQQHWLAEYYRRERRSFADLPDGKFVEMAPDFNRIRYTTAQGHIIAESL